MEAESSPPIKTLSGASRSRMAVPSAKNSGLDSTENMLISPSLAASRMVLIAAAVRTGRVLFSTTLCGLWPPWTRCGQAPPAQIAGWPAQSFRLRRGVHGDEHHVSIRNRGFYGSGKTEVSPPGPAHRHQTRLIDRQPGRSGSFQHQCAPG